MNKNEGGEKRVKGKGIMNIENDEGTRKYYKEKESCIASTLRSSQKESRKHLLHS